MQWNLIAFNTCVFYLFYHTKFSANTHAECSIRTIIFRLTAGITGLFEFTYLPDLHPDAQDGAGIYNKNEAKFDPVKVIFYKKSTTKIDAGGTGVESPSTTGKEIILWKGWSTKDKDKDKDKDKKPKFNKIV